MNSAEILALVNLVGELAMKGIDAYEQMKALAAKAGISEADLAAADARFGIEIHDPLAVAPADPSTVPSVHDGDIIWRKPDGTYFVQPSGIGIVIPPTWVRVS